MKVHALLVLAQVGTGQFSWPTREIGVQRVAATRPTTEEAQFGLVSGVVPISGGVVVADRGNHRAVMLGSRGESWVFGRQGTGPGDFTVLGSAVACGGGLLGFFDARLMRLTTVSEAGKLVGTHVIRGTIGGDLVWCGDTPDDVVISVPLRLTDIPIPRERYALGRATIRFRRGVPDTLGVAFTEMYVTASAGSMVDIPFGQKALSAAGGGLVYVCASVEGQCLVSDLATGVRDSFVVQIPRKPLPKTVWDHEIRRRIEAAPTARQGHLAEVLGEVPRESHFGRFSAVRADDAGRLWVRSYDKGRWLILNRKGQPIATVTLPSNYEPYAIDRSGIVGIVTNEDGEESVERYAFTP